MKKMNVLMFSLFGVVLLFVYAKAKGQPVSHVVRKAVTGTGQTSAEKTFAESLNGVDL